MFGIAVFLCLSLPIKYGGYRYYLFVNSIFVVLTQPNMLQTLHIKNFALIEHLNIDFSGRLSTITGETGAGKSILLGALGLVLGNRADLTSLKDKEQKCVVEAHLYPVSCFL